MHIIVCMKQVLDPEAPISTFRIDPVAKRAIPPEGTPPVINPFDENALEAALRLKDSHAARISVVSMGPRLAKPLLRKALAAGADHLFLLEDTAFEDLDSYLSAYVLASAIRKIGTFELILCGRQASDTDAGQVGSGLAEMLRLPCVTLVKKVELTADGRLRVERVIEDGYETIALSTPAVLTVSNEVGELRFAPLKDILAAAKKPVTTWTAADLGLDSSTVGASTAKLRIVKLFIPVRESKCRIIDGESPEAAAENLAVVLRASRAI